MNMDLMQLEAFLDARCGHATEQANRHLSEKARHDEEAQRSKQIASFCGRAATRVRGLREYLLDAPSGLTIGITATVEAEPAPGPAPVDEPAARDIAGDDDAGDAVAVAAPAKPALDPADEPSEGDNPIQEQDPVAEVAVARAEAGASDPAADQEGSDGSVATDHEAHAVEAVAPVPERLVPRFSVTPEADGLTEYDQRFLDVMRLNLDRHGICSLKPADVADLAGIKRTAVGASISRLAKARRVIRLCRDSYRVALKGASFPPASAPEPVPAKVVAPKPKIAPSAPVPSLQPLAVETVAEKLMELFVRAATNAGDGMAMFGREGLEKRFDVSAHRIEEAVYLLESRGESSGVRG